VLRYCCEHLPPEATMCGHVLPLRVLAREQQQKRDGARNVLRVSGEMQLPLEKEECSYVLERIEEMQRRLKRAKESQFSRKRSAWSRLWEGWYRFSTPASPPADASLEAHEIVRRARVNSVVVLMLFLFNIPSFFAAVYGSNRGRISELVLLSVVDIIAIFLNKRGLVTVVGTLIWLSFSASIMTDIVTTPGGLSLTVISLFLLLILPQTLASVMLPPLFVFVSALLNILFCTLVVTFLPHPASMDALMPIAYANGIFLPITVLGITAVISFLAQQSLGQALRDRDRAQEILRLERNLALQTEEMLKRKVQLEQGFAVILETQTQVANGNVRAHVPLPKDHLLWPVASVLNTLIARLRRFHGVERELEVTRQSAWTLVTSIQASKAGQRTLPYQRTGTVIDPIAREIFPQEGSHASRLREGQ